MSRRNEEVATLLENIAELLAAKEDDPYRIRAYEEAARSISTTAEDIEALHRAGRLQDLPRVGESIAAKVAEYLDTGSSAYYEELKRQIPARTGSPSTGPT